MDEQTDYWEDPAELMFTLMESPRTGICKALNAFGETQDIKGMELTSIGEPRFIDGDGNKVKFPLKLVIDWGFSMSAKDQLRNSGLFYERCAQKNPSYKGTIGFTLHGYEKGPTIYTNDLGHFQIRVQALENNWFPNNARLLAFVLAKHFDISKNDQRAYMIHDTHIGAVIDIIDGRASD